jgi:hypothetical protein
LCFALTNFDVDEYWRITTVSGANSRMISGIRQEHVHRWSETGARRRVKARIQGERVAGLSLATLGDRFRDHLFPRHYSGTGIPKRFLVGGGVNFNLLDLIHK